MSDDSPTRMPQADDDRTVMGPGRSAVHPSPAAGGGRNVLTAGTRVDEFEILELIGEGGFGIVYLAHDHALQRRVALKEYLPASLASRTGKLTVTVLSERDATTFEQGLRSFVNEARLLAQFDHPSLVKVYRFWEANGTAYMVMPYYDGPTLREALRRLVAPPDEYSLKRLLSDLLDALAVLHAAHCVHRDIAPDNILVLPGGRPLLLDFGAARRVIGDRGQALTVILKPGYAPVEQYADTATMEQGPWTDIYALAAVAHFAIMGQPPPASVARMISDPLEPLSVKAGARYSAAFLSALDRALAVRPEDRPRDTDAMRALLGLERRAVPRTQGETQGQANRGRAANATPVRRRSRRMAGLASAGVVIAGLAAGAYVLIAQRAPRPANPAVNALPAPSSVVPAQPPPRPTATTDTPTPPAKPFDPIRALDEVFDARSRTHAVDVSTDLPRLRIGEDRLRFSVQSAKPGYLYVLMVGTDRSHLYLLFPNSLDKSNHMEPGRDLQLPRPAWQITAVGPPGTNHFVAIVSDQPRDFAAAGLVPVEPFSEFRLDVAERLSRARAGAQPLFAGTPVCPLSGDCSTAYGAAVFAVEEVSAR
jgi:Protein kinase domain/Domain of unknown function (DUF4384)